MTSSHVTPHAIPLKPTSSDIFFLRNWLTKYFSWRKNEIFRIPHWPRQRSITSRGRETDRCTGRETDPSPPRFCWAHQSQFSLCIIRSGDRDTISSAISRYFGSLSVDINTKGTNLLHAQQDDEAGREVSSPSTSPQIQAMDAPEQRGSRTCSMSCSTRSAASIQIASFTYIANQIVEAQIHGSTTCVAWLIH